MNPRPFLPISSYGAIGNLRTVALVGSNGSIDWCCLPQLDSPSVFGAMLDRYRGGRFSIAPAGTWTSEQQYWSRSNVLETTFQTAGGRLILTDWMPVRGKLEGCGQSQAAPQIYRRIRAEGGDIPVELWWTPRLNYGRDKTSIGRVPGGFLAEAGEQAIALSETFDGAMVVDDHGAAVRGRFLLRENQPRLICTRYGTRSAQVDHDAALASLEETAQVWRSWLDKPGAEDVRRWAAADTELIARSELALKLLIHGETGGIAAAATTSLPEVIGGVRNWDYRFAWIRDASQIVESLLDFGHRTEAIEYVRFIEKASFDRRSNGEHVGVVYGLDGRHELTEQQLRHWEGYRLSRPVNIGNQSFEQVQHDSYGEILNCVYELARQGEPLTNELCRFAAWLADLTCDHWKTSDHGIWEMRGRGQHFVYTRVLCWVALDRALELARRFGLKGNVHRWRIERDRIREEVLRRGFNEELGAFVMTYDSDSLDAANLLIPMHEFLPHDDPRVQGTIDQTLRHLTENGLVYRYRADDGLPGKEGAFGIACFWLTDALAFSGRLDEAEKFFDQINGHANHLGLYSEEFHPRSGELLGNFPQGLTHIGFLDSAIHLAHARGGDAPIIPPIGSTGHRQERERIPT